MRAGAAMTRWLVAVWRDPLDRCVIWCDTPGEAEREQQLACRDAHHACVLQFDTDEAA